MADVLWAITGAAIALGGFALRRLVRRRFGMWRVARFAGELAGWLGYFLALTVWVVQINGGWHSARGTNVESRSTWSEEGPILLVLGTLLAVWSFVRLERAGEIPVSNGDEAAFSTQYVADVLSSEHKTSRRECKQLARSLLRTAKRTGQPLPPALMSFVARHLDRRLS